MQYPLRGHNHWIFEVNFSHGGHLLATASADKNIGVWSVERGHLLRVLRGHSNIVWSAVFITKARPMGDSKGDGSVVSQKRPGSQEALTPVTGSIPLKGVTPSTELLRTGNSRSVSNPLISNSHTASSPISAVSQQIMDVIESSASPPTTHLKPMFNVTNSSTGTVCPPTFSNEKISEEDVSQSFL